MKHTGSHTIIVDDFDNVFCDFIAVDANLLECAKCGNKIAYRDLKDANDNQIPKIPCRSPLIKDNASKAIIEFAKNIPHMMKNLCDETTIENRLQICKSCDNYKDHSCTKCGCAIIRDRNYLNKIAIRSEVCPIGLWDQQT